MGVLSWTNLEYFVDVPYQDGSGAAFYKKYRRRVVKGISALASPGEVLAIMGGSGSGKTCTLDALAFRTSPTHTNGEVYLNAVPCNVQIARTAIGLVVQDDRLMPNLTVRETLTYAAQLRHRETAEETTQRVSDVLLELELFHVKDLPIGDDFVRGLSGGQRRRVSIALQLLMDPQVLLLDEPTTGLDSTTAFHVMETLNNLAKRNRTVITTIHQPASEIFPLVDKILLLSKGRTVYFGTRENSIDYFDSVVGLKCPSFTNPFDFFIDISSINHRSAALELESKQQVAILSNKYESSVESTTCNDAIRSYRASTTKTTTPPPPRVTATYGNVISILVRRMLVNLSRNANGLKIRLFQLILFAFLLWVFMGRLGNSQASIQNRFGYLYESISGGLFMGLLSACGLFPDLRDCFIRERVDSLYSSFQFVLSYTLHALPTDIGSVALFCGFGYFAMGLAMNLEAFFNYYLCTFYAIHFGESLGLIMGSIFKITTSAQNGAALTVTCQVLLASGMLRSLSGMPTVLIDLGYSCITKYLSEVMTFMEFRNLQFDCPQGQPCQYSNGTEFIAVYYPNAASHVLRDRVVGLVMIILARLLVWPLLHYRKN